MSLYLRFFCNNDTLIILYCVCKNLKMSVHRVLNTLFTQKLNFQPNLMRKHKIFTRWSFHMNLYDVIHAEVYDF